MLPFQSKVFAKRKTSDLWPFNFYHHCAIHIFSIQFTQEIKRQKFLLLKYSNLMESMPYIQYTCTCTIANCKWQLRQSISRHFCRNKIKNPEHYVYNFNSDKYRQQNHKEIQIHWIKLELLIFFFFFFQHMYCYGLLEGSKLFDTFLSMDMIGTWTPFTRLHQPISSCCGKCNDNFGLLSVWCQSQWCNWGIMVIQ